MHTIRLIALCAGLLGASLVAPTPLAHAQDAVVATVDFAPPPLPVYDQPAVPGQGIFGSQGIGDGVLMLAGIGCRGRGFSHRRSVCYGRPPTGPTVMANMCSTTAIGRRKSASTAV